MTTTPSDKYLHFTVGLLKGSSALEALQEDAVKHHMIEHPGQLIALRLTEYYEMMNRGIVQPVVRVPASPFPLETEATASALTPPEPAATTPSGPVSAPPSQAEPVAVNKPSASYMQALLNKQAQPQPPQPDTIEVIFPTTADQNADDAADYWTAM